MHKLTIRNASGLGSDTTILLDDRPLNGAVSLRLDLRVGEINRCLLELYVEVDAEVLAALEIDPLSRRSAELLEPVERTCGN